MSTTSSKVTEPYEGRITAKKAIRRAPLAAVFDHKKDSYHQSYLVDEIPESSV